ncbi:MAG: VCBS repeat-containing protein, partial [Candidatus Eisenbacteria bacterium]|nr:VCBS repeat-containing protein [Candidatus Eisenbacteria bacterium]
GTDVYVAAGEVQSVVVADFNADGRPDIATGCKTSNNNNNGKFDIFTMNASPLGKFTKLSTTTAGGNIRALAVARMNSDSTPDLILGERTGNAAGRVELWANDGAGAFTMVDYATADGAVTCVAVGLIDQDAAMDIVAGNEARTVQSWFCDNTQAVNVIPANEDWADANTGGTVNAVAIGKIETSVDTPGNDPLNDIVVGTAITATTGDIIIYLNPYVDVITP